MPRFHFATAVLLFFAAPLIAQDQSVKPGINKSFEDPNVPEFVGRFETEGRDVYDRRGDILTAMNITPGMSIADVGAGTGLFTRLFSVLVGDEGKVYAVDISENFVKHIDTMAAAEKRDNVVGVLCTADDTKLPPESIDLVFICDTYHHFEYPQKTMASIHRALKPGGRVVLIDFHRIPGESREWVFGHVRAGQEVFTAEIEAAGFRQIDEEKGLLDESYFVTFEKVDK